MSTPATYDVWDVLRAGVLCLCCQVPGVELRMWEVEDQQPALTTDESNQSESNKTEEVLEVECIKMLKCVSKYQSDEIHMRVPPPFTTTRLLLRSDLRMIEPIETSMLGVPLTHRPVCCEVSGVSYLALNFERCRMLGRDEFM